MRRFLALARSAALEALAEPLSAVLFLSALVTVHLMPVFHCHQFGEAGRLSRECGFSALLVFGLVLATSAAVRAIGREIESGTAAAALARPVPRPLFFCAKTIGVLAFFGLFAAAVSCATLLSVVTAETVAVEEHTHETLSRFWGPGLASGVGFSLLAFGAAALANRFWHARFAVCACLLLVAAQPCALLSVAFLACASPVPWRFLPAQMLLVVGCSVFVAMAGALAVRFRPAPVTAFVALSVVLSFVWPIRAVLPDIALFWQVDGLAGGGTIPFGDLAPALGAGMLLILLWMAAGSVLMQRRDIP